MVTIEQLASDRAFCVALVGALDARALVFDDVQRHADRYADDVRDALLDAIAARRNNN